MRVPIKLTCHWRWQLVSSTAVRQSEATSENTCQLARNLTQIFLCWKYKPVFMHSGLTPTRPSALVLRRWRSGLLSTRSWVQPSFSWRRERERVSQIHFIVSGFIITKYKSDLRHKPNISFHWHSNMNRTSPEVNDTYLCRLNQCNRLHDREQHSCQPGVWLLLSPLHAVCEDKEGRHSYSQDHQKPGHVHTPIRQSLLSFLPLLLQALHILGHSFLQVFRLTSATHEGKSTTHRISLLPFVLCCFLLVGLAQRTRTGSTGRLRSCWQIVWIHGIWWWRVSVISVIGGFPILSFLFSRVCCIGR